MDIADLKSEIDAILHPEPDDDDPLHWVAPHSRLSSVHGLDTSYYRGPFDLKGDGAFKRLLDESDPLQDTLQSVTVPLSLFTAAFQLFGDSLLEYHDRKRKWDVYRFYPSILMTVWAAFEAWLRISSEILVAVAPALPRAVKDALLETREVVEDSGDVKPRREPKGVLARYRFLLKHGCADTVVRGSSVWQAAELSRETRNCLVHYDVRKAPSLTTSGLWGHMEAVLMLLIAPSTRICRTLFEPQFDLYSKLVALHSLMAEFEERPLHKGWPKESGIFDCPFDGVDAKKYPLRRS